MAATLSLFLCREPHHSHHLSLSSAFKPLHPHRSSLLKPSISPKFLLLSRRPSSQSPATSSPLLVQDPFQTNRFLTPQSLDSLKTLESFDYPAELGSGSLRVRVMRPEETDDVVGLLSESFAESMLLPAWPGGYVALLSYLVKQYLIERRSLMPYTATLIGFYREHGDEDLVLGGTVEVCFDRRGANVSPPTPTPPKDLPYVCNMSVKKQLRRRGIGWHLLKASEQLISQMSPSREVYLHCRMIDTAPLNMYAKAGYSIFKTDSILILLTLQRRKHLMRKELPVSESESSNIVGIGEESL